MSGIFDYLFDSEYKQRDDIETLKLNSEFDADNTVRLKRQLERAEKRLDRTELVLEALFVYLENQGLVNKETLATLIREVDRLDGKEDGKAGIKPTQG